jgi:hypothetical protein
MSSSSTCKTVTKRRAPRGPHAVQGGTSEANRRAVAVLEVLGGLQTPTDAAAALGIALPRYYQLETRALEGMIKALEPRPLGKQPSPEGQLVRLKKELEQTRRECARQQALVRATQRSLGLKPASVPNAEPTTKDRAGRRKRRPTVRALKAAAVLRVLPKNPRDSESAGVQQEASHGSERESSQLKGGPADSAGSSCTEEQSA